MAGPVIGLVATGCVRLIGWVSHHHARGRVEDAFLGADGLALMAALFALKPLVTALCLGSGASGGLFTPTLSTGAMLGGAAGAVWSLAWPGTPVGAYALVGAAAMLGAGMQAPLAALVLMLELTGGGFPLAVPRSRRR